MSRFHKVDLYKVLGVTSTATIDEIKKAYRILALKLHPDVTGNDKVKAEKFRNITIAYETLSDEIEKGKYDDSIGINKKVSNNSTSNKHSSIRSKIVEKKGPIKPEHFNVKEWNAWHYGDDAIQVNSVKQTRNWMDLGKDNKDQQYYRKKAERTRAKIIKEASQQPSIEEVASDTLRQKRDDRKTNNDKKDSDNCIIT
jgi:curved DNA-binding protein CbpA